jgi:hypothetical protein
MFYPGCFALSFMLGLKLCRIELHLRHILLSLVTGKITSPTKYTPLKVVRGSVFRTGLIWPVFRLAIFCHTMIILKPCKNSKGQSAFNYLALVKLCRNQETKVSTMDANTAVRKLVISNPGTMKLTIQSKRTLIRKAATPKVISDMGSAITCRIGRMNVFTMPNTIAATKIA